MRSIVRILCGLGLMLFSIVALAVDESTDASQLLSSAQVSVASIVSHAGEDTSLASSMTESKPFWKGIQDLTAGLELAVNSLKAQNDDFFEAIGNVASGYAQAEVGRIMSGSESTLLANSMKELSVLVTALYQNYSKEAARLKQGGELTEAEKQALENLKAQQAELLKKLEEVEKKVGQNNEKITEGINQLREQSKRITDSGPTVHGFVGGFFAGHVMYNWMWGWHWWWGPWGAWAPGFININIGVWDSWADAYVYDWAVTEGAVDLLELEGIERELDSLEAAEVLEAQEVLAEIDDATYTLEAGELGTLTDELDLGWDDVATDRGLEVMDDYQSNFEMDGIWSGGDDWNTFDSMGMDDFGVGFGDMGFDF